MANAWPHPAVTVRAFSGRSGDPRSGAAPGTNCLDPKQYRRLPRLPSETRCCADFSGLCLKQIAKKKAESKSKL